MAISKAWLLAGAVVLLALAIRLPGLGSFMTADEENWMVRSGQYYHNLFREADPGGAFMTTHPGATTMWIAGAGIVFQEARLGFDIDTSNLTYFRRAALVPMVIVISLLLGIAAWQLMKLLGVWAGIVTSILLVLEPYLVGMSQIVHLDMLLALFMLNSLLAFLKSTSPVSQSEPTSPHLRRGMTGIFAGLAMATKLLPSVWLFVFFGLYLILPRKIRFAHLGASLWLRVQRLVRELGFISGIAILTFFFAWPALWTAADLGRSFERDVPSVIKDAHVAIEDSSEQIAPASFYGRTLLGRTTPFVLILVVGGLVSVLLARSMGIHPLSRLPLTKGERQRGSDVVWLFMYSLGFLLLITLAAKKADRYALPALVALPILAGVVLGRIPTLHLRGVKWAAAVVGVLLLAQTLIWSPQTIAYNSPFFGIRPLSQQGWGEGLEEAAAWLNRHPLAGELYVASWYPSVFQNYFNGKTFSLSSRDDNRVSYVVLYRNMFGRAPDTVASDVLDEYRDKTPVQIVTIQGTPYVWIYATDSTEIFKQHVGEIIGENTVGQLVPVEQNSWQAIEIGMANFSNRANTQDVILHVRESLEATQDIRTARVNAREIQDGVFHRFEFEPIENSAGKTFYVFLESPTSRPGDAVTVRFSTSDILPGEMVKNGEVNAGRDIAWRIPR